MVTKALISFFFVGIILICAYLLRTLAPSPTIEVLSPTKAPETSVLAQPSISSPSTLSSSLQPFTPVSLQDLSSLTDPKELNDTYQRLTSELILELAELQEKKDQDRIKSSLKPIAQKFYYLRKTHTRLENAPPFQLPQHYDQEIQRLEDLWNRNHVLAETADSIFAQLDILNFEHVPYQLRENIITQ